MLYGIAQGGKSVAYCALSIQGGTRSEYGFPEGIAHFTEHTIFKGTARKSSRTINNYLDRRGGDLNAYTTREEIVLHAMVLKEDLWRAASLLLELATCPTFPEDEIETERGVVIDEILSYKDSPADDICDCFEEKLFAGHPLSRRILGTEQSVREITREDLLRFTKEGFTTGSMALTIVSPDSPEAVEQKLLKFLGKRFAGRPAGVLKSGHRPDLDGVRYFAPEAKQFDETSDKGNHEANAIIGGIAPSIYGGKDRIGVILLANIIGGPASNSMLNDRLRERNGWVYGVDCSYSQYSDTGVIAISLGCEKENLRKCLRAIDKVLREMRDKPLTDRHMEAAKRQLLGQQAIAEESGESLCLAMGRELLSSGRISTDEELSSLIMSLSSSDIQRLSNELFAPDRLSRLAYL